MDPYGQYLKKRADICNRLGGAVTTEIFKELVETATKVLVADGSGEEDGSELDSARLGQEAAQLIQQMLLGRAGGAQAIHSVQRHGKKQGRLRIRLGRSADYHEVTLDSGADVTTMSTATFHRLNEEDKEGFIFDPHLVRVGTGKSLHQVCYGYLAVSMKLHRRDEGKKRVVAVMLDDEHPDFLLGIEHLNEIEKMEKEEERDRGRAEAMVWAAPQNLDPTQRWHGEATGHTALVGASSGGGVFSGSQVSNKGQ